MDAIDTPLRSTLVGLALGLATGLLLKACGALDPLTAAAATLLLAAAVALFVPARRAAVQTSLLSPADLRTGNATSGGDAELDRWIRGQAAQGRAGLAPADLAAAASRDLGRIVGRSALCGALERLDAARAVARAGGAR